MGLSARVYTHFKRLSAAIDLDQLSVDPDTGEVTSESNEQFIALEKEFGNVSMIAWLASRMTDLLFDVPTSVLLSKVLYSGSHSGDFISSSDFPALQREIDVIRHRCGESQVPEIDRFLAKLEELIQTAQEESNPIVFV